MTAQTSDRGAAYQKTTLDNGLRVVTSEMPRARSVSLNIFIGVGSRYETAEQAGISHFVEHMVFKGTRRRPTPMEISATIEGSGGMINAGTEQELTVYWCKIATPHFSESVDLLIDMLRNPLLDPEAIDSERMVVFEELGMINDYPSARVDALLDEMLWPGHPLGRDVGGTKESVAGISREMMLEHMAHYYTPPNIVICVAGNVSHEDAVSEVASLSEGWAPANAPGWAPITHAQEAPQLRLERRRTEQTHLSIGIPGLSLQDPDRYALDLLSVILGEGMSSRLFVEVREKRGLAYDIHSGVNHFLDCGALLIVASVDPKGVYEAVRTILAEVSSLRDGVPEEELDKAKRLASGRLLLRMEDTRAVSSWVGYQELLLGRILDADEVVDRINAVTADEIRAVADGVLVTEKLNMAVVGPTRGERRLQEMLRL